MAHFTGSQAPLRTTKVRRSLMGPQPHSFGLTLSGNPSEDESFLFILLDAARRRDLLCIRVATKHGAAHGTCLRLTWDVVCNYFILGT